LSAPNQITLKTLLDKSIQSYSSRPALARINRESLSYAVVYNRVQALSQNLIDQGIEAGDRVGLYSDNMPNWTVAFFSIVSNASVAVAIPADSNPQQVRRILKQTGCRVLFVSRRLLDTFGDLNVNSLQSIILIDNFEIVAMEGRKDFLKELIGKGEREWNRFKKAALQMAGKIFVRNDPNIEESSPAAILFTSGREGLPKAVLLTHHQILLASERLDKTAKMNEYDRLLSVLPLSNATALISDLITPFIKGSCMYFAEEPGRQIAMTEVMNKVRPTLLLNNSEFMNNLYNERIAPALNKNFIIRQLMRFKRLRRRRELYLAEELRVSFGGQLRLMLLTGSPLNPDTERFLSETDLPYSLIFGVTEACGIVSITSPDNNPAGSAGKIFPGIEIQICSGEQDSEPDEICIRGEGVVTAYYENPELSEKLIDADGWIKTGDRGFMDKDGFLFIRT